MAGTLYTGLIQAARFHIRAARGNPGDTTYKIDSFWSEDELFDIAKRGTTDLWGAIIDLHQEHYFKINETDVSLTSGGTQLSGVPTDCFRVYLIEPLNPTTQFCAFVPRPFNHIEFMNARATSAITSQTPSGINIFYDVTNVGSPLGAPDILTAPKVNAAVPVRFVYVPTLGVQAYQLKTAMNPIPGESDNALIAWIVAYALGKETPGRTPNAGWLSIYNTEKQGLLTRIKPRQEQEAQYADGVFDQSWR